MLAQWTTVEANEEVGFWAANPSMSMNVDWGDGTTSTYAASKSRRIAHTYAKAGTYISKWDDVITEYGQSYANSTVSTHLEIVKFGDCPATLNRYAFRTWPNLVKIGSFGGVTQILEKAIAHMGGAGQKLGDMPNVSTLNSIFPSGVTSTGIMPKLQSIGVSLLQGYSVAHMGTTSFPLLTSMNGATFSDFYQLEDGLDFPALMTVTDGGDTGCFRNCAKMPFLRCPALRVLSQRICWTSGGSVMRTVKLGAISEVKTGSYNAQFRYVGNSLDLDEDGFKTSIWVKNTMASLRALTNWPWETPKNCRFICTDGYVSCQSNTWINHAWDSVESLPRVGDKAYTFAVDGISYSWNGAQYISQ